ncbi:hypothetical protein ACNKHO_08770 [Shigella flexneri]
MNSLRKCVEAVPVISPSDDFLEACQRPLRRSLRVNTLKITVDDFLALVAHIAGDSHRAVVPRKVSGLNGMTKKHYRLAVLQNILAACFIFRKPAQCCRFGIICRRHAARTRDGRGGRPESKTTKSLPDEQARGMLLANEFSAAPREGAACQHQPLRDDNTALTHFDGRVFGTTLPECFDAILLDAPCSGEGVVRKDPDALETGYLTSNCEDCRHATGTYRQRFPCAAPGGSSYTPPVRLTATKMNQLSPPLLAPLPAGG